MTTTWFEQGIEQGKEQGRAEGERKTLRMQLEGKFGPLTAEAQERLETLPADRIAELALAILHARSLQELGLTE